ncbi:MAG: CPBP family glutamic-type intramembrane protease [Anaerolineae bacterium]|nr:CPBP family glutamic-type intramembrane protease [Anaerolineae bacterium]
MSEIADRIDPATTTPPTENIVQTGSPNTTHQPPNPAPHDATSHHENTAFEWGLRIVIWGVVFFAFTRYISQLSGMPASTINITLFSVLTAFIFFASTPLVSRITQRFADAQAFLATLLPMILLVPLSQLMKPDNRFELSEILLTAIALLLPIALAVLNTPVFRWADFTLGWFTVIVPLLLPFTRITPVDPPQTLARIIVGVLPLCLVFFTTRAQKMRLNYLFICAMLSLWATYELGVLPILASDPGLPLPIKSLLPGGYLQLALLALGIYMVLVAGKFNGLGFSFAHVPASNPQPNPYALPKTRWFHSLIEWMVVLSAAAALLWASRAYRIALPQNWSDQALPNLALFFLLSALPAELLFRGVLLRYLRDGLRLPNLVAISLSALAFALAALPSLSFGGFEWPTLSALTSPLASPIVTNLPVAPILPPPLLTRPLVEFGLNVLMGVFYARLYLRLRNLPLIALVHAFNLWLFWLFALSAP